MADRTPIHEAAIQIISDRLHNSIEARASVETLIEAGWVLIPPSGFPGMCDRCKGLIEPGTTHHPFNGNQMFACEIVRG